MITAWDIYWVMQLDSIGFVVFLIGFAFGVVAVVAGFLGYIDRDTASIYEGASYDEAREKHRKLIANGASKLRVAGRAALCCAPILLLAAFIPSTKTAAAMIVLPAVANNKAIQQEAGELYGIAKDALRELARPKPAKESAE